MIVVCRGAVRTNNEICGVLEGHQHHIQRTRRGPGLRLPLGVEGTATQQRQQGAKRRALVFTSPLPGCQYANHDCFTAPHDDDVLVGIKASEYFTTVPPKTARRGVRLLMKRG